MKKSSVKNILKLATGVTAVCLVAGEITYERLLNRKFINENNVIREIGDVGQYYGTPDEQVDGDSWFVSMNNKETVIVNSLGKNMRANIFMQNEPTDKWAIVIHGYTATPRSMAIQGFHFYKSGFNVLMPTLRGFGTDEEKYCSMGYHDRYYVKDWVNYIIGMNSDARIVVLGESMGSATTMLLTGEQDLPANVKCAVADCGYTSCWDEYCVQAREMFKMPAFPVMHSASFISKLRGNFDFKKCSPIEAVSHSSTPTLFIHGEDDTFVPYWMMNKLFDACTAEKEKLSVPNATHANSGDVDPRLYFSTIDRFVSKYI